MIDHLRRCSSADLGLLLTVVCIVSSGCGRDSGPPMGHVTGTVTYQGKPVAKARVTFLPTTKGTQAATGVTDAAGKYALGTFGQNDGAIVGPCQVAVELHAPYEGAIPEGMGAAAAKLEFQNQGKALIPEKYFSPQASGLTADVKPGRNTFDFSLTD